jgi:hypothetical protein
MCSVPLFYLTKDVSEGPPTTDCFTAAVEDITDNKTAAIIFAVTGLILIFAILGVFPLCSSDNEEEDDDNNNHRRKNYEVDDPKYSNNMH